MARAAVITDGVVTNVIEASAEYAEQKGFVLTDSAQKGDRYDPDSGEFLPPPGPSRDEICDFLSDYRNQVRSSQIVQSSTNGVKARTNDFTLERVKSKITYFDNIGDDQKRIWWDGPDDWYQGCLQDFKEIQVAQEEVQQAAFDTQKDMEGREFASFDEAQAAFDEAFMALTSSAVSAMISVR